MAFSRKTPIRTGLWVLHRLLAGEHLTVPELQEEGLGAGAARRYLQAIEEEIPEVRGRGKKPRRWFFEWPSELASDKFSLLVLCLVRSMMVFLRESQLDVSLRGILEEHTRRQPGETCVPDVSRMFFAATRMVQPLGVNADVVDRIAMAIFDRVRLRCRYSDFKGYTHGCVLEPYSLIFADEGLYLYARCEDSDKTRHVDTRRLFNVARFESVRVERTRFTYPERDEYDPERLFRHCFGIFLPSDEGQRPECVVLQFRPHWRHYLTKHRWHATQSEPIEMPDDRLEVRFELHITNDLVRWIRGLGLDVEVREPVILRDKVKSGEDW